MILTLGQIISRSSEMAGGRKDWEPSDISYYANLAYTEVIGRARFRGMEAIAIQSTVTGENKYALPPDFDYDKTLRATWSSSSQTTPSQNSNQLVLMKRNMLQLEDLAWSSNVSQTTPQYYTVYGDALQLWPTPTSSFSLTLHYQAKPQPLLNSFDTLVIDDRWHIAVLLKTVALLEASRGDVQAEAIANGRYGAYVNGQPNADALNQQARYGAAASFPREYFGYGGSLSNGGWW